MSSEHFLFSSVRWYDVYPSKTKVLEQLLIAFWYYTVSF